MNKELLIEIDDLTWGYDGMPDFVFNKFNFKLYKSDFVILVGKSWSWKTSLIKFLIRHLKPPYKKVFYKKEDIARFTDSEVQKYRRKMWVIYQDYKLIDWKTVFENVAYPLEMRWIPSDKINKMVKQALYKSELYDKKDVKIPFLSWWEKQRVAIARALTFNPEFIIADEPTWNLDPEASQKIVDLLINLNKQQNTILLITHDMYLIHYIKWKYPNIRQVKIDSVK